MKATKAQTKVVAKPTKKMTKAKTVAKKKKGKAPKFVKIEAKPLTETQIQEFLKHYNVYGSFPGSKIPCNMTGKLTTCVGPWMIKKIKEYGSAENLLRNYKCRGALKQKREALKPVKKNVKRRKVLQEMKNDKKEWDLPKMNLDGPKSLNESELSGLTKDTCLRPDIFLNNDRFCNGCEFFDVCTNSNKGLKPTPKKKK
jgi:hypothetical protein